MRTPRFIRFSSLALLTVAAVAFVVACVERSDRAAEPAGPNLSVSRQDPFAAVIAIQNRHSKELMSIPGVVGTGTGRSADGPPAVFVLAAAEGVTGVPASLEGAPVQVLVTGEFTAFQDGPGGGGKPTNLKSMIRPVPNGVSTSRNDQCAAGTMGAGILIGGAKYALSNNHVFAKENAGGTGDPVVQPGRYDNIPKCANELATDEIGTLSDFEPIDFSGNDNTIDAAVVQPLTGVGLTCATPPDFYGAPSATTVAATVGLPIQKVGRTSGLTTGTVFAINVTVNVTYSTGVAHFISQIGTSGHFSRPGDSGSLIVTNDADKHPVALLFAGTRTGFTSGNPIDAVLARFSASICTG